MDKRTRAYRIYEVGVAAAEGIPDRNLLASIAAMIDHATRPPKRRSTEQKASSFHANKLLEPIDVPLDGTPQSYGRLNRLISTLGIKEEEIDDIAVYVHEKVKPWFDNKGAAWTISTVIRNLERWVNASRAYGGSNNQSYEGRFR